jgi:hypothetical protein
MINVKSAVRAAIEYLQQFQEFIPANAIRLEETEYDDTGYWLITLSTEDPNPLLPNFAAGRRNYKIFRIDAESGEVKSMKVRTLQPIE